MDVFASQNRTRNFWLLLTTTVAVALVLSIAEIASSADGRGLSASKPTNSALPLGLDPGIPTSGNKRVRVKIFLSDNSFSRTLQTQAHTLTAPPAGTAAAKALAIRSPKRAMPAERVLAARMDAQRNEALSALRRGAVSGTKQSESLADYLKVRGARIIDASPLPNAITATVPAQLIRSLAARADVISIRNAPEPIWMSSPIDGSETWHVNGLTGNGTSADSLGGPDYVIVDQGVRISHQAFRIRLAGDPANGLGSGPSRITSPVGRSEFSGSQHGNVVAATVASTNLTLYTTTGPPYPAQWPNNKGLAYGVDKVYDAYQAQAVSRWVLGLTYNSEPGVSDIPEAFNYSAGIYEDTVDANPAWSNTDSLISQYGVTNTISGGNCGINPSIYTGCNGAPGDTPHRVSTPGNLYNTITVGGLDLNSQPYNPSLWIPWANSSPGPTYGGRKKPDLITTVSASGGAPVNLNDTDYSNPGLGTSMAAPQAAAAALLLASSGVYTPIAQKAILLNTATPIQGQTYWTPTAGWGALNLDGAYYNRGNYVNANVTSAGDNGTRFFRQTGVVSGDRTTLVWNRRTDAYAGQYSPPYFTLTDLDLFQVDEGTGANTASGGVDTNDTVDTDQTISAANPIPGNGTDGQDNVEQTRSTAAGTQIYKVKAQSSIDGATSEPFAIAGAHPITALETPIPTIDLAASTSLTGSNTTVTVTATISNPSTDLELSAASTTLSLPAGASLVSGTETQAIGTLAASGSTTKTWQVQGSTEGLKNLTAEVSGTTYGETFVGDGTTSFTVDATPPAVSVDAAATWSTSANVPFTWSASDALSSVDHYDVELARSGGAYAPLLTNTTATSDAIAGSEGEQLQLRVRAADAAGNLSAFVEHTVTIDAVPPEIAIGSVSFVNKSTASIPVTISNIGAPVAGTYRFGTTSGVLTPATTAIVSFTNTERVDLTTALQIEARDALGRVVNATRDFRIPTRFITPTLRIRSVKANSGKLTVKGAVGKAARGRITLTFRRIGKQGKRRAVKRVYARNGRFTAAVHLPPGRYKLTASLPASGDILATKTTRKLRVK